MDGSDGAIERMHAAARRVEQAWADRWREQREPAGRYALHFRGGHAAFADALASVGARVRRVPSARFGGGEPCEIVVECSFSELQDAKAALKSCSVTDTRCRLLADLVDDGRE